MDFYTRMQDHMMQSQIELKNMYNTLLPTGAIVESNPEFGKFSHALRVDLPCGMKISVSRANCLMQNIDRTAIPWEIAIVDPECTENHGVITDQQALYPEDDDCTDAMVKFVGRDVHDYNALEMELRRINQYYVDNPIKPDAEVVCT